MRAPASAIVAKIDRAAFAIAYPPLRELSRDSRSLALQRARDTRFDTVERAGMGAGLAVVTALLRPVESADLPRRLVAQWRIALLPPVSSAGPFLLRRTRRGLDREIARRRGRLTCNDSRATECQRDTGTHGFTTAQD